MKMSRLLLLLIAWTIGFTSCGTTGQTDDLGGAASAIVSNTNILGFEQTDAWTTSSGTLSLSDHRLEGAHALAISGLGSAMAMIQSVPLTTFSGATEQVSFELLVPSEQPNPYWYGFVELYLDAPAEGVHNAFIGHSELTGGPVGVFQPITFPVPAPVAGALQRRAVDDLRFRIALTVPAGPQSYLLDGLHFGAPFESSQSDAPLRISQFDVFAGGGVPADPDISVSPTLVGTITQLYATFYTRSGAFDHQFMIPTNDANPCCDSKIVYDVSSGRWFLSVLVGFANGDFGVEFFVSTDSTATDWKVSIPIRAPELLDNPNITVASDKVAVASEHCVWVVSKSGLIAGGAPMVPASSCGIQNGDQIYGVQYGTSVPSTAYLIAFTDDSHINWLSVEGAPDQGTVAVSQHVLSIAPLAPSPPIVQRGGPALESGGVLAMWQSNHLVWSRTEGCGPSTAPVTCPRMFDVNTSTNTVTSFDFSMPGTFLWSSAPGLDRNGNMWAIMAEVTPTTAPGLAIGGRLATGQVRAPVVVVPGIDPFGIDRWGDYFSAAQDPVDGSVWLIGQYGAVGNYGNKAIHVLSP